MKLGETVACPHLEGMSCVRMSLCNLFVPGSSGGRAGSEVRRDSVFCRVLVGGGAGDGGVRARVKCEPGLLLCSIEATALLGWGVKARPRGLQKMLQEAGLLKGMKAVSALVRASSWTPGLGAAFQH